MIKTAISTILILLLFGCGRNQRLVIVEPDQVQSLKSTEWTIKSEPKQLK